MIRRRLLLVGAVAAIVVTVVLVLALLDLVRVRNDLDDAATELRAMSSEDLAAPGALPTRVDVATMAIREADSLAHGSRWLGLIDPVPWLGRHVDAVQDVTAAAREVMQVGAEAVTDLDRIATEPRPEGETRVETVDRVHRLLQHIDQRLGAVARPTATWVLPPVSSLVHRFQNRFDELVTTIEDGRTVTGDLSELLQGPSRLLLLALNNAEMRAGMGMPLQAGIVVIRDGVVRPPELVPTDEIVGDEPVPVAGPLAELYGWLEPGTEWRNVASSPNFPQIAPVFADLARAQGWGEVDAVVAMDVLAVEHVLEAVGPIAVRGIPLHRGNVTQGLLNQVYLAYGADQELRRTVLAEVLSATVTALTERPTPTGPLMASLARSVRGRHLMAWSSDERHQHTWELLGADGALDPHGLLLAVQNHGGYKLDWYVRPTAEVSRSRRGGEEEVVVELTVENTAPPGLPDWVAGSPVPDLPTGSYRAFVTVYVPRDATDVTADRDVLLSGRDGPMRVVAVRFDVAPGEAEDVTIRFRIPRGDPLHVLPSARSHPIPVTTGGMVVDDRIRTPLW